ncbi:transposase [Rhodococcus globerulus]|uniref:Transposase n=1 Tax=Rhodococcus globerulus TaxID=33008 RepID=A0ABU4C4V8_RHOGO|nr:transposase [Rhodococcus globerulus]MDV6271286.1 transposase [Rhodococcus globerulus]
MLELDREVKDLDKQIAAVFRRHRHAHIIESVPGIGTRLGAEFLAATGGDMTAFGSAAKLAAYAGLAPVSAMRTARIVTASMSSTGSSVK